MAPRPPTTPRCGQCRRKKIKCDYVQPRCGPCARSQLECTPFVKGQLLFVEQRPRHVVTATEEQQWALVPSASSSLAQGRVQNPGAQGPVPSARSLARSPFLAGKFTRAHSFGEFVMHYVPDEFRKPGETCITWVTTMQKHQEMTPSTDAGVHALGLIVKGKATMDSALIAQSMKMYGVAVSKLRNELQNPKPHSLFKSLVSSMVLLQYENLSASMQLLQGHRQYAPGIASILKLIKPTHFQQGDAHSVFLHCRAVLIMTDVLAGASSFITDDEWLTVPFKHNPKAPFHTALDLFSKLTHVRHLARSCETTAGADDFPTESWDVFNKEWRKLDDQFIHWLKDVTDKLGTLFQAVHDDKSTNSSPSRSGSSTDESSTDASNTDEYPEIHVYRVLEDAAAMLTYWTGRLMLLDHMRQVAQSPHTQLSAVASQIVDAQKPAMIDVADDILRTIPFCLRSSSGVVGMQTIALPLRSAVDYFAFVDMPDRVARCQWFAEQLAAKEVNLGRSEIRLA